VRLTVSTFSESEWTYLAIGSEPQPVGGLQAGSRFSARKRAYTDVDLHVQLRSGEDLRLEPREAADFLTSSRARKVSAASIGQRGFLKVLEPEALNSSGAKGSTMDQIVAGTNGATL
jgi:hypothetical protein